MLKLKTDYEANKTVQQESINTNTQIIQTNQSFLTGVNSSEQTRIKANLATLEQQLAAEQTMKTQLFAEKEGLRANLIANKQTIKTAKAELSQLATEKRR